MLRRLRPVALACILHIPTTTLAADPGRAEFEQGVALYEAGKHAEAAQAFEASYQVTHNPRILFNVSKAHAEANHPVPARKALERYMQAAGTLDPERRSEVEALLGALRRQTAEIEVTLRPPRSAKLSIDGITIQDSVELVTPGQHVVRAEAEGAPSTTAEKTVVVGANERTTVVLTLPAPAPPPPEPEPGKKSYVAPAIAWGASALLVGATVGAVVLWSGANADLDEVKGRATTRDELSRGATRVDMWGGAAIGAGVAAVGTIGLATWLTLRPAPRQTALRPLLGPGAIGLQGVF